MILTLNNYQPISFVDHQDNENQKDHAAYSSLDDFLRTRKNTGNFYRPKLIIVDKSNEYYPSFSDNGLKMDKFRDGKLKTGRPRK